MIIKGKSINSRLKVIHSFFGIKLSAEGGLTIIAAGETCGYYYNFHINSEGVERQY